MISFFIFSSFNRSLALQVTGLNCNYESRPYCVDDLHPLLSWQLTSESSGTRQIAYRILVASSPKLLANNMGDLWDSKKVSSEQSLYISYKGKELQSDKTYYWKVQVWDHSGDSAWSEVASWHMGLLHTSDWKAKWISASRWFTPVQFRPKGLQLGDKGGWADIDLGEKIMIDHINLVAHDTISFPQRFRIIASDTFNFISSKVLVDFSNEDFHLQGKKSVQFSFASVSHRFLRLQILPSSNRKETIVRQMEVYSNGRNVALMKFTREYNTAWDHGHAPFLVDGMPSENEGDTCPADACPSPAAPEFRKTFTLSKKIKTATVYYAALGMTDVTINGKKVTDELLTPPFTDYSKRIMYTAYDVTDLLTSGDNTIGVILGNGFFTPPSLGFGQRHNGNGPPRFLLQIQITYTDGKKEWIGSDRTWKWSTSEITFNDVWAGYTEDRNLAKQGWDQPYFDDHNWQMAAEMKSLPGKLVARKGTPNKINGIIYPISVQNNHAYFSTVSVGWPQLKLIGKKGQHITISGSGPGYKSAKLNFILAEDGPIVLSPRFIIQPGPIDLQIDGLDQPLALKNICIQYVNANLTQTGDFTCSNPYLDSLFHITMHTHRNYMYDFPADPNREKQGWTQDVQNMFNTAAYFTDVRSIYARWWDDMADAQDQQGYLGSVVPMVNRQVYDWNSPWWSGMIIFLPWEHYLYYGNITMLSKSYEAMKNYVGLLGRIAATGEGQTWNAYPYYTQNLDTAAARKKMIIWNGAGDWNNPYTRTQHAVPTPINTMTAWFYYANIVGKTASLLGEKSDAVKYAALAEDIRKRFNESYFHPQTGLYGDSTNNQTAQVLPLATGMVPEDKTDLTYQRLVDAIHLRGDHIGTGFISTNFLLQTLASHREAALANKIINQRNYPSWATLIKKGVLQEGWYGGGAQMPSCGGAVGAWLFQSVLGIRPDTAHPGFKTFILAPQPDPGSKLVSAKGHYDCPYGRIWVSWTLTEKEFVFDVTVPANTTALLQLPWFDHGELTESGSAAASNKYVSQIQINKDVLSCWVQPGQYHFKTSVKN
ncbi:MAG: alpha-L-rhamnosidase N-terminal domain-containing protein [Bacteroidota bacterium]|nr:alpha-L-rhamnosidase N-terminal domain-containing protein [Bacteroidota bacterium]